MSAIIEHGSDADALRAIQEWTNRAWGRPKEHVETTVKRPETIDDIHTMEDADLDAYLAELEREGKLRHLRAAGD